jgi:hypothetical protein
MRIGATFRNHVSTLLWGILAHLFIGPISAAASVDLRIEAHSLTAEPCAGEVWDWTVNVENKGSATANNVRIEISRIGELNITNITVPGGTFVRDWGSITAQVTKLEAGGTIELTFSARPSVGGFFHPMFHVSSTEPDAIAKDNSIEILKVAGINPPAEGAALSRMGLTGLKFSRTTGKLYACAPSISAWPNTDLFEIDTNQFVPRLLREFSGGAGFLRKSSDDRFLHMLITNRHSIRMDLTGALPDLVYPVAESDVPYGLRVFEVHPYEPETVLSARVIWWDPNSSDVTLEVAAFQSGVKREGSLIFTAWDRDVENLSLNFNSSTEAYLTSRRMVIKLDVREDRISETGRYFFDEFTGSAASPVELVSGTMYSSYGYELEAATGKLLRRLPNNFSSRPELLYQPNLNQLVYVDSMHLKVFDRKTFALLGSVPNPSPEIPGFVEDLGDGRVAVVDRMRNLVVFSSQLLSGELQPATDLGVSIKTDPPSPKAGDEVTIEIVATNFGAHEANEAGITVHVPDLGPPFHFSSNPSEFRGSVLLWSGVRIPAGTTVTNTLRGRYYLAGHMPITAGIADRTADTNAANDVASLVLPVALDLAPGEIGIPVCQIIDATYDRLRNRIIATTRPDSHYSGRVIAINPATGLVEETYDFGPASLMALADDSTTLYLAVDESRHIVRANLSSGKVDAISTPALDGSYEPEITWMGLNPGTSDELFIATAYHLAFLRNGQLTTVTNTFGVWYSIRFIVHSPNQLLPYGSFTPMPIFRGAFESNRFSFSNTGISVEHQIRADKRFIVANDGTILETDTLRRLGRVTGSGPAIISAKERTVYNFGNGYQTTLQCFDITTQSLLWDTPISVDPNYLHGFEAGTDFVAYEDGRFLRIVRKKRLETGPATDLSISLETDSPWRQGIIGTWKLTVGNGGTNIAPATRVDLRLPNGFRTVQVTGASVMRETTNHLTLQLGNLSPHATSTAYISTVATETNSLSEVVASVRSDAAELDQDNNTARLLHPVENNDPTAQAPNLEIRHFTSDSLRMIFQTTLGTRWLLLSAPAPGGPWSNSGEAVSNGQTQVLRINAATNLNTFFQLRFEPLQ